MPTLTCHPRLQLVTNERFLLTRSQMRVLQRLPLGLTTHAIAEQLGVGDETVKTHRGELIARLEARNGTHALTIAYEQGLLRLPSSNLRPLLSRQETRVLRLIASGNENEEIAAQLDIGAETVKTHRGNVAKKLDARNACQMVARAYESGVLKPGWLPQFQAMQQALAA